jgi:hypothetical protein
MHAVGRTTHRKPRLARLRQPHEDIPRPLVTVVRRFRRWRVRFVRIRFWDGDETEVEADLLAPPW